MYRGRHHRREWVGERLHIEVRGLAPDPAADPECRRRVAAAVERNVRAVPGVSWAAVNPVLARVVVALHATEHTPPEVHAAVLAAIEAAERQEGVGGTRFPVGLPEHPADREASRRALTALLADTASIGFAIAGAAVRLTPLPTEFASLVGLADSEPHVRHLISNVAGPIAADLGLALAAATTQGLAHGPVGVLSDMAWRAAHLAESAARRSRWAQVEAALCGDPVAASAPFVEGRARPESLPKGAVETYADRAAIASVGAAISAAVTTGDPRRAAAGLYAGLPKAARLGREVFAVHVTRWLSTHGAVVLDRDAIRRLDRIDTVVLDASARPSSGRARRRTEPVGWERRLVAEARRAGFMVVVAGSAELGAQLGTDLSVTGGDGLIDDVRGLQTDGCGVLLVAGGDPAAAEALWAADVGVGVWAPRATRSRSTARVAVPWAADIILPASESWRVVHGSDTAGHVSRQSVALAVVGAAAAATVVFGRPRSRRYGWPVNFTALVAMANATRAAAGLDRVAEPVPAEDTPAWHALGAEEVLALLGVTREGLSHDMAATRIPPERRASPAATRFARAVLEELANPLTPVLAGGAALSAALGGTVDAGIVGGVTAANALLGGLQRWRTGQAADALAEAADITVHVRRQGGMPVPLSSHEIVRGDLLVLRAGDALPADARILESDGVLADESPLTGESFPVEKSEEPSTATAIGDRRSMLYAGTSVAAGEALAVVVATGNETEAGAAGAGQRHVSGGVEARLGELTRLAIPISVGAGAAIVVAGILRGRPLAAGLASGVSVAVAAVPEGLPLVATMAQLSAAQRLATKGVLVRNHRAIEALGRIDILCTDKTGTLTVGRLAVRLVSDLSTDAETAGLGPSHRRVLAAALRATPEPEDGRRLAHPTDASIVAAARDCGVREDIAFPGWHRVAELPFEPTQGFHATIGRKARRRVVSVKGAPEVVLPRCARVAVPGEPARSRPIAPAARDEIEAKVEALARRGLRVLAVAEGPVGAAVGANGGAWDDDTITGLTLLGLVAIADPVRPEAASAVHNLQEAGVGVCMVTGDHPSTAEGIAAELGILNGHRVMGGGELSTLSDAELDQVIGDVSVFARATPADKVRIVQSFQRSGRVVAMTGDGANDAPAIRLADVGVALGSRSTAAARDASDVIVTNDDIETLIAAVVEGRALWGSVRDALAILLGGNLGEIVFALTGAFLGRGSPLSTRQVLLVNLLTDVAPALAIATRPPPHRRPEDLLGEGPERSLGRPLERAILARAGITALGATAAWLPATLTGGPKRASTVALVALVGTQLAQTLTSGGNHPVVLAAGLGSAGVLVGIVQTPGVSQLFGCTPLDPLAWAQVAAAVGGATAVSLSGRVVEGLGARVAAAVRTRPGGSARAAPALEERDAPITATDPPHRPEWASEGHGQKARTA